MFEQNRDPNYFKEHQFNTNCGSFAFNICEWYCPDENFAEDDYELAYRLVDMECMDEYEVMCMLFERDLEQIHKDFKVKDVDGMDYPLKKDEELIAFRMCLNRSFWEDDLVVDYHFRVKGNGKWMEKCGCGSVREIEEYNEEPWMVSETTIYSGPIAYFVRKCS